MKPSSHAGFLRRVARRVGAHAVTSVSVLLVATGIALTFAGCVRLPDRPSYAAAQPAALRRFDDDWFAAARVGRVDILRALVEAGYPLDATNRSGYTAVILAAYDGQPAALDYLLNAGADPCMGDHNGNTALMGAIFKGESQIAQRLMDTRCAIDATNHAGETPLAFAVLFGRLDLVPPLVKRGANPNHVDARGRSLLEVAAGQRNESAVAALRSVGATQ
nr:ankyrin repeat domain-containing protein [Paraburkholderia kururiensis]